MTEKTSHENDGEKISWRARLKERAQMKIVIPGGTGQTGGVPSSAFRARGDAVVVRSRGGTSDARGVEWDGRTIGPWASEIDGADVALNLAGRSVNCRYTDANLEAM